MRLRIERDEVEGVAEVEARAERGSSRGRREDDMAWVETPTTGVDRSRTVGSLAVKPKLDGRQSVDWYSGCQGQSCAS